LGNLLGLSNNYITVKEPNTKYARRKIAMDLIQCCGFKSILDESKVSREVLNTGITRLKDKIESSMNTYILPSFPGKSPPKDWKLQNIMKFINGILEVMYGLHIIRKGTSKKTQNEFVIKHLYYGVIFDKAPGGLQPYIEPGWRYKFTENNVT
jgi:hypothetical protein